MSTNTNETEDNSCTNDPSQSFPKNKILERYAQKHNITYEQAIEEVMLQREQMKRDYRLRRELLHST